MSNQKMISFNEYYIYEFFNHVREKTTRELSPDNHRLIDDLFTQLSRQDELTEGIGKLAQEKASGELSIFLFDIFDRAQDYPPTELVDALSEIAEDFVSALSIMLEEEGTTQAIEKVNSEFRMGRPLDESKEVVEEVIEEEDEELLIEETEPEKEKIEEQLKFQDYIELSFFEDLKTQLKIKPSVTEDHTFLKFTRIVLDNIEKTAGKALPGDLMVFISALKQIFPWRLGETIHYTQIMDQYTQVLADCGSSIKAIDVDVINNIVENSDVEKFEAETAEEPVVKEEIPEEPTTIDNLLSEYFQAEVDHHLQRFDKIFTHFKSKPAEPKNFEQLIKAMQSFKEICMIHGYVLLEDFCSEMIALITNAKNAKKIFNIHTDQPKEQIFHLLKQTNRFKESKPQSAESKELEKIQSSLEGSLFLSPDDTLEAEPELTSKVDMSSRDEEIKYEDRPAINRLFYDLLKDLMPMFGENLTGDKKNVEQLNSTLSSLLATAEMIDQPQIAEFLSSFKECVEKNHLIDQKDIVKAQGDLKEIYHQFCEQLSDSFKAESVATLITGYHQKYLSGPEELTASDRSELLKILLDIEKQKAPEFRTLLTRVLCDHEAAAQKELTNQLQLLSQNFAMLDLEGFKNLPDAIINRLPDADNIDCPEDDIQKIAEYYLASLDAISEHGEQAEISGKIDRINQLIQTEEVISEKTPAPKLSEESSEKEAVDVQPVESADEEDLDEIFRNESDNCLVTIDQALGELSADKNRTDLYANIEKSLHSLKSSARLMGHDNIADVAAPLEEMFENLHNTLQELSVEDLKKIRDVTQQLKVAVSGSDIDTRKLTEQLKDINIQGEEIEAADVESETIQEEQLFAGSIDEDEDLLDIFKEESSQNIRIVEEANRHLQDEFQNKEALGQLENAMHSLKSAAKMLGFREIGDLADAVETAAVAALKGEIKSGEELNKCVTGAIELIKELTEGNKQNIGDLDKTISDLNPKRLAAAVQPGDDSETDQTFEAGTELDDQTKLFVKESWELLEKINRDMVDLERNPKDQMKIENINRLVHTLKGSAQILNFNQIGTLAHKIEDLFEKAKSTGTGLDDETTDLIFKGIDILDEMINSLKSGGTEASLDIEPVISRIDQLLKAELAAVMSPESEQPVHDSKQAPEITTKDIKKASKEYDQEIRISTDELDKLIDMAAELLVSKSQLTAYLEKMKKLREVFDDDKKRLKNTNRIITTFLDKTQREENKSKDYGFDHKILSDLESVSLDFKEVLQTFDNVSGSFRAITQDFEQNIGQISNLTKSIHDDILQARMVPAEMLFNRFPRAIRDMAKNLKKKVNVVVEGEETEMDRALIESLADPVMHLIRNAIDHGIETPNERKSQGKNEDGIILLKANRDKNQIVIEVHDDGRGIDPETVKKVLQDKGLVDKKELSNLSTSEILSHLFSPGFSTRDEATDISGRGVGLDVVAHKIQELKGDIQLNSEPTKGTIFTIKVPLTLAIAQSMLVEIGTEVLAIPIASVEETIQFKDPELVEQDEKVFITVADKLIPVVYLTSLLKFPGEQKTTSDGSHTAVIVQDSGA